MLVNGVVDRNCGIQGRNVGEKSLVILPKFGLPRLLRRTRHPSLRTIPCAALLLFYFVCHP